LDWLSVKVPSRVKRCSFPCTTKKPSPSIAMSLILPVASIEPGEKFFSMAATMAPSPRWLGFCPPKEAEGGAPAASVT
jgi:hypothetical protein